MGLGKLCVILLVALLQAVPLAATNYCVDHLRGNDHNSGLCSQSQPWATIDRVNRGPTGPGSQYQPGDTIKFRGGQTFTGTLRFSPQNCAGTNEARAAHPMVIGSYGAGRATLKPTDDLQDGFDATDIAGFNIANLNFTSTAYNDASEAGGSGRYVNSGIYFINDRKDGVKLRHVNIDRVNVRGFAVDGILFFSSYYDTGSGFENVRMTNATIWGNGDSGIGVCGDDPLLHQKPPVAPYPYIYSFTHFYVGDVVVHDNPGIPTKPRVKKLPPLAGCWYWGGGNGIVFTTTQFATVEHSTVYHNGWKNSQPPVPNPVAGQPWMIGIGPNFNSDHIVVQYNEVYDNYDPKTGKGDWGLDFDGGTTNSVFQYNYSHGNAGGMFVCGDMTKPFDEVGDNCALPYPKTANNVVRYNVFENDGMVPGKYGELQVRGGDVDVYNNTLYASNPAVGPLIVVAGEVATAMGDHLHIYNNILDSQNGEALISSDNGSTRHDFLIAGNAYYDGRGGYKIIWGKKTYHNVRDWSEATGQERLKGAFVAHVGDPELCNAGHGGTIFPRALKTLTAYKLRPGSPLIGAGLNLLFGVRAGSRDFYGNPIPAGRGYDIGADEYQPGQTCR